MSALKANVNKHLLPYFLELLFEFQDNKSHILNNQNLPFLN